MSKLTLDDVANLQITSVIAAVNANSAAIEEAFENTLSLDGTSPNEMDADLDMNSNRIYNLPAPAGLTEPVRLTDLNSLSILDGLAVSNDPFSSSWNGQENIAPSKDAVYDILAGLDSEEDSVTVSFQKHIVKRILGNSDAPVVEGTDEDNEILNTGILNALAESGQVWELKPGSLYRIQQIVYSSDNFGFVSDGTGTFYAPVSFFDNEDATVTGRYAVNANVIDMSGLRVAPFTARLKPRLEGVVFQFEEQEHRVLNAVHCSNVEDAKIDIEVFGIPVGCGIVGNTLLGDTRISGYFHDFYDNTDGYNATPVTYAIMIDNDPINGVSSEDFQIVRPRIQSIQAGATFISAYGHQPGAISILSLSSLGWMINEPLIKNIVGGGIELISGQGVINGALISDCSGSGMKLIHGTQGVSVTGGSVLRCAFALIEVISEDADSRDTSGNRFSGMILSDLDPEDVFGGGTGCIYVSSETTHKATNNLFTNCLLDPGANGLQAAREIGAGRNDMLNLMVLAPGQSGRVYRPDALGKFRASHMTDLRAYVGSNITIAAGVDHQVIEFTEAFDGISEFNAGTGVYTAKFPCTLSIEWDVFVDPIVAGKVVTLYVEKNVTFYSQANVISGTTGVASLRKTLTVDTGDTLKFWITPAAAAGTITVNTTDSFSLVVYVR